MTISKTSGRAILAFSALALTASHLSAEEGMFAFHGVPAQKIQKAYGFAPSQQWLDHLRLSSVRLMDGGSGSFVSSNGLLLTNHHVALGQLQKASDKDKKDYVKDGFYARGQEQELKTDDLEINVLVSMENVTARVEAAVAPGAGEKEANEQRKAEMARIEKESTVYTGLRSDVVSLYDGGEYWLYRYKKFTDVRLVMAPEIGAAFYGGDPDNFTYPRHALDFAFFRVYENGKPFEPPHFLKWSEAGLKDQELAFVSGHPGRTERLKTLAQLESIRDIQNPDVFERLKRREEALLAYAAQGPEQERQIKEDLFGVRNSLKVYEGRIAALSGPKTLKVKEAEEKEFRAAVERDPELNAKFGKVWDQMAQAQKLGDETYVARTHRRLAGGTLAGIARTIVFYVEEAAKPNAKRWKEFRDSALESLNQELFSPSTLYPELEKKLLVWGLRMSLEKLGAEDPAVKAALGGKTPEEAAEEAVSKTRLFDVAYRKELVEGGVKAVSESSDPLIRLAAAVAPYARQERTRYEDLVESAQAAASAALAKARFAVYGTGVYPDATFTLRLSYGKAAGYEEGTTFVPYKTTFYGLYNRAEGFDNKPPFDLPAKVAAARGKVNLSTPLDFVTTNDIIGGNSGSPVVNQEGELVGLIFDGNIQSLEGDFLYRDEQNRALAVHSGGILEAMTNIYGMNALVAELVQRAAAVSSGKRKKSSGK